MSARPKIDRAFVAAVAATFCKSEGWDADEADDLARVFHGTHMDGYELAKELESRCCWSPTAQDVETLDNFSSAVREAHRQACIAWARDANVQPPLPIGAMTTRGEITGIYAYDGACYEIRKPGDADPTRRYIVRFEDAVAATGSAA